MQGGVINPLKHTAGSTRLQDGWDNTELSDAPLQAQFVSIQYKTGRNFDSHPVWINTPVVHERKQYSSCKQEDTPSENDCTGLVEAQESNVK